MLGAQELSAALLPVKKLALSLPALTWTVGWVVLGKQSRFRQEGLWLR